MSHSEVQGNCRGLLSVQKCKQKELFDKSEYKESGLVDKQLWYVIFPSHLYCSVTNNSACVLIMCLAVYITTPTGQTSIKIAS